jgi:RNA polymerase sigma factor (sigma-70 family)
MANAPLGTVVRHIRNLVAARHTPERTDVQLLHAFAQDNDHAAFATLVQRHGPLVQGVCRHVLRHTQDAEDAFQATFLVLARKAAWIRNGEALVSWLHGVAYRMAMNAKRNAARRRQLEGRARTTPPANPSWEAAWREVQTLLDEEIQRLPERYRAPFLLCCVENQSRAEAARQLGVKEGTVWSRLAEARKRLQARLARRGVTLAAVLGATALARSADAAAVPEALAETTARTATLYAAGQTTPGELVSAEVASLVKGVTPTMFVTKLQIATTLLLVGTLIAAGAAVLARHATAAEPAAAQEAEAITPSVQAAPEEAAEPRPTDQKDDADEPVVLSGRVLDPQGKPAAGAKIYLTRNSFKSKADLPYPAKAFFGGPHTHVWAADPLPRADPPLRATTGPDGRFTFTGRRAELAPGTLVLARVPGYGPDWVEVGPYHTGGDVTLRLAQDDVPINGRVLGLEGQPIGGITVTVLRLEKQVLQGEGSPPLGGKKTAAGDEMAAMKKMLGMASIGSSGAHLGAEVLDVPTSVRTGADGSFRLTGFGRDRLVRLRLQGSGIENTFVYVQTRPGPAATPGEGVHAATFDCVPGPSKPIVGTVREKGSGKPVAGVVVGTGSFFGDPRGSPVQATTDGDGRYRLEGVSKIGRYVVTAGKIPYFGSYKMADDTPGLEPLTVDFELERGIAVRGRLTDKATGKPVRGLVSYYAPSDNPHLGNFATAGQFRFIVDRQGEVGPDGSFAVVALPGPGLLCVWADDDRYMRAEVAGGQGSRLKTVPIPANPIMFHAIVPINPSEKEPAPVACDIALEPGHSLTGSVVGPDGQPVPGVLAAGLTAVLPAARYQTRLMEQPLHQKLEAATFTARGFNPRQPRTLVFVHPEKGLGKIQTVRGDETSPLEVRLEPLGALTGRVLDAEGRPWAGLKVAAFLITKSADSKTLPYEALHPLGLFLDQRRDLFNGLGTTDADGRFRIEGLIPGLKYGLQPVLKLKRESQFTLADLGHDLAVSSGQTKDLGDLRSNTTPEKVAKEQMP